MQEGADSGRKNMIIKKAGVSLRGKVEKREGNFVYLKLKIDGEEELLFGIGKGKLQVIGRGQVVSLAPEITLDAAQKIGQYKMESRAAQKESELYPRGGTGIAAVAGTEANDRKRGTESSLGDYIQNAFSASARVGATSCLFNLYRRPSWSRYVTDDGNRGCQCDTGRRHCCHVIPACRCIPAFARCS